MGPIHPTASDKRTGLEVGIVTVVDDVVDEFLGGVLHHRILSLSSTSEGSGHSETPSAVLDGAGATCQRSTSDLGVRYYRMDTLVCLSNRGDTPDYKEKTTHPRKDAIPPRMLQLVDSLIHHASLSAAED